MSALPTGTVTFLFADVEGSTRLARELGDGLAAGARRHPPAAARSGRRRGRPRGRLSRRRALRRLRRRRDGRAGRDRRAAAARAATTGPRPCASASASTPARPALGEDGYVGVDVHRAYRIAPPGHGGQIVASEATAALLDAGRDLRDLGLWALPDLPEPERIFQLDEPGLGGDFPPLRARPGRDARARRPRRRLRAPPRGDRPAARGGRLRRRRRSPATPRTCSATSRCTSRTSRSSTSACRRRRPTRGCARRKEIREQPPGHRRARPLPVRRAGLRDGAALGRAPRASATCSRTASPTSTSSPPRSAASPRAAPRSTRRSSASSSAGAAATTRSTS